MDFFLLLGLIAHLIVHRTPLDILGITPEKGALPWYILSFYGMAILTGGWFIAQKAWISLCHLKPDMHLLMTAAALGAMVINQWFEGATVVFLFSVAQMLEHWSVDRARRAIGALLDLSPTLARVIGEGEKLIEKQVEDVFTGELVLVRPGEYVPLDGFVVEGSSSINQAPITGESMPVSKKEGDLVFAGTLNEEGALRCQVTKEANDTTLARIIQMVQEARAQKGKSEQWVDRFARVYTPIMMGLALLVAVLPPLFFGLDWMDALYRALVLLVIACPCALVISTPVSIVAGLTASAKKGALIKGGIYLEALGKIEALAFDKTGTITMGEPAVQRVIALNGHTEEDLLQIACALEKPSEHPLARAILKEAANRAIETEGAKEFQIHKGLGAEGRFEGKWYWIGSHRFMHQQGQETEKEHRLAEELEDAGHSVIAIGDGTHICGLISVADAPRPFIKETLSAIRSLGVKKILMLTGDNLPTATALAAIAGIDDFRAELLPEDKVDAIRALKKQHRGVAMVGDGVNDAPAMATAHLGIAMGAMGTDAAFETADVVLMGDDLALIPQLIRHSRKSLAIIKQNIIFALCLKLVFIVLATFGLASLWMAIAADTGATLLVIFNGLRLLRYGNTRQFS